MANSQIQAYADMVNLQVAAEAFWGRLNGPSPQTTIQISTEGNKNNSKEPDAITDLFDPSVDSNPNGGPRYKLIAHQDLSLNATTISELGTSAVANKSGFSASIFFDTVKNEYTLSIRSTEFADSIFDGGDIQANLDIGLRGWAFAQVSSMGAFWNAIVNGEATNGVNATTVPDAAALAQFRNYLTGGVGKVNVTGYSLGANVAEAFVEMHRAQVAQAYRF